MPYIVASTPSGPLRLLIDTGSNISIINNGICDPKSIRQAFSTIKGIGDITTCNEIAHVKPLPIFAHLLTEMKFFIIKFHDTFDGLLGNDILQNIDAVIDYNSQKLFFKGGNIPIFFSRHEEDHLTNYINKIPEHIETFIAEPDENQFLQEDLNREEKHELSQVLKQYSSIFHNENDNLTFTNSIKHSINTKPHQPLYSRSYRYPEIYREEVENQLEDMLKKGIIRHSKSPYSSPIWVVPKKLDNSGKEKFRIVIDYRKLNDVTISDKFPIPLMDDILSKLGNSMYFTTIDLAKGFHQIEICEQDIEKTAFSTNNMHYEFLRMPFGLKNAPATFQRLMNNILSDYIGKICYVYLDDIIIFSTSLREHITSIRKIFQRLKEANLKIQPDKCAFLKKHTDFLGHIISTDGIKPNPDKLKAINNYRIPKTPKEIKRFLGLVGYYRKFIKDFARIAKPMTSFLKQNSKVNINCPKYIEAFETLKTLIINPPILKYPDFSKTFTLTTDASNYAIGAVLSQSDHPISFASRTLNDHETRYSTIEKELLAIIWATKYFRPYLYGRKFIIETDHKPLQWLSNLKEPNMKLQRWKIRLSEYDYEIVYVKGKTNYVADALSREPIQINTAEIYNSEITTAATIHSAEEDSSKYIEITEKPINLFRYQLHLLKGSKPKEFNQAGGRKIIRYFYNNYTPEICEEILKSIPEIKYAGLFMPSLKDFVVFQDSFVKLNPKFKIIKSVSKLKEIDNEDDIQEIILKEHIRLNHRGIKNVFEELKCKFYFKNLIQQITKIINNCHVCSVAKYERRPLKIPYKTTETPTKPNQTYYIDIWFTTKGKFYLTCIDKFSKFLTLKKLKNRNWIAIKTALAKIFLNMGKPKLIICDNERAFTTENLKNFLDIENIKIHFATINNKTSVSDIEKVHANLNEQIRIYNNKPFQERNFSDPVTEVVYCYNHTTHSTTGQKPIELHRTTDHLLIKNAIERMNALKDKSIEKANQNRRDEIPNYNYIKKHKKYKLDNIFKKITPQEITDSHAIIKNKKYYKQQFMKAKRYTEN